ncbi:hypothetical protein [Marinobacter qingdaonensis]|uniref:Uncharacterized protein n=1 Tax=Marinobacter qingdaonensis TaxID=3108486 RepID=A0ABU5NUN3_9GAMM|nr:hypothetical protein [Marinobacter sp. ASW11-75]MEA1079509.1 hypothetical protein [Marinobacter sp. ASW11-75]
MNRFLKEALTHGCTQMLGGLTLHTRQHIQMQQKSWPDDAPGKHKDFSDSPFWLQSKDGRTVGMEKDALI